MSQSFGGFVLSSLMPTPPLGSQITSQVIDVQVTPTTQNGSPVAAAPINFAGVLTDTGGIYSLQFNTSAAGTSAGTGAYAGRYHRSREWDHLRCFGVQVHG